MISGLIYWIDNSWETIDIGITTLEPIVFLHTFMAFSLLTFIIIHVYMTTTGPSLMNHIKAMISGWKEVEESVKNEELEKAK